MVTSLTGVKFTFFYNTMDTSDYFGVTKNSLNYHIHSNYPMCAFMIAKSDSALSEIFLSNRTCVKSNSRMKLEKSWQVIAFFSLDIIQHNN